MSADDSRDAWNAPPVQPSPYSEACPELTAGVRVALRSPVRVHGFRAGTVERVMPGGYACVVRWDGPNRFLTSEHRSNLRALPAEPARVEFDAVAAMVGTLAEVTRERDELRARVTRLAERVGVLERRVADLYADARDRFA